MKVNICGLPHLIVFKEDTFNIDTHFGQIDYARCLINVNKDLSEESKKETICHEMVHGMLVHIGYDDLAQDEQFVQALGNAIYQGFDIKYIREVEE
jgi:ssRNA-specific RNase YbeY (16S rRNA maturation enzyme)